MTRHNRPFWNLQPDCGSFFVYSLLVKVAHHVTYKAGCMDGRDLAILPHELQDGDRPASTSRRRPPTPKSTELRPHLPARGGSALPVAGDGRTHTGANGIPPQTLGRDVGLTQRTHFSQFNGPGLGPHEDDLAVHRKKLRILKAKARLCATAPRGAGLCDFSGVVTPLDRSGHHLESSCHVWLAGVAVGAGIRDSFENV